MPAIRMKQINLYLTYFIISIVYNRNPVTGSQQFNIMFMLADISWLYMHCGIVRTVSVL